MYSTASRASRRRPNARRGDDDDVDIARLARASSPSEMMMGKTLVETHRATRRARRASAEKEGAVTRMKLSSRRDGRARRVTARAGVKDVDIGVSATETTPRDGRRRRVMNDGQRRARATRAMEEDARKGANSTGENVSAPRVAREGARAREGGGTRAREGRRHPMKNRPRGRAWAGKRGTDREIDGTSAYEDDSEGDEPAVARWMMIDGDETMTMDDDASETVMVTGERGTTTTTEDVGGASAAREAEDEPTPPATDEAWDVINSFPIVRGDMVMCAGDGEQSYGVNAPFIPPEFIERPIAAEAEGSDNEAEEDEEEDARRFSQAIRESSLLCEDDDVFDDDIGAHADFISEPVAFAARREARELAAAARVPGIDFMVKSGALLCDDDYDAKDGNLECSAMTNVSDYASEEEHFATAADGRVFRVSQALVAPSASKLAKGHGKHRLEDSANRGGNDSEDSDADLVVQSARKAVPGKKTLATKRKRRPDAPIRRVKAAKKEKGSSVRATDIYVMSNGKRQRRGCLHCGTVKTPQWRMGPEGKKTLCNACGVRFMKGIL